MVLPFEAKPCRPATPFGRRTNRKSNCVPVAPGHDRAMSFTTLLWFVALAHTIGAQIPGVASQASAPVAQQTADPLERTTPRGAIAAFIRAVEREDYVLAARYLQVNESQRRSTKPLAHDLK